MNAGLILAGGTSERLIGYDKPKQFIEIGGKMLILYCLRGFEQCADIALICIVISKKWRYLLGDYIFAEPGDSRQHSIYNGLFALKKYAPERIVIHDAVRPLVTSGDISNVIAASLMYDGATPTLGVTDTIYRSNDGKMISKAIKRDELFAGQTPECYDFKKYLAIHKGLSIEKLAAIRGSSEIAINFGMQIAICPGNANNFKITTNTDLERFRMIVENGERI